MWGIIVYRYWEIDDWSHWGECRQQLNIKRLIFQFTVDFLQVFAPLKNLTSGYIRLQRSCTWRPAAWIHWFLGPACVALCSLSHEDITTLDRWELCVFHVSFHVSRFRIQFQNVRTDKRVLFLSFRTDSSYLPLRRIVLILLLQVRWNLKPFDWLLSGRFWMM